MIQRSTVRAGGAPVIEIAGVRKRWPRRTFWPLSNAVAPDFLSNVTFTIGRGEIVVILGENGAGKTTLLKIIAGLARPDAGTVRVLGQDAIIPSPTLRRRVAYAGGERGFYFRLTVRENLRFFGALDDPRAPGQAARIVEVTQTVDLERDLDRRFADLSSGQRQRLAFARALIADPDILLLDEPTRALDPPHASSLRHFIRKTLAMSGKTIIVATNLIDEALELGDRIAVLRAQTLEFVDLSNRALDEREMRELFGMAIGG
jgi:ABC-2 type transport system ATP-binding protein